MTIFVIFLAYPRELFKRNKETCCLFLWTLGIIGYLAVGAKIFMILEGPHEVASNTAVLQAVENVKSKFPEIPDAAMKDLFHQLSAIGVKGLPELAKNPPEDSSPESKWTFGNAFLFCFTLITTVGYGHLSPWTYWGKIFAIVYTGIGIPLTLFFMTMYVNRITAASKAYKITLFRGLKQHLATEYINFIHVSTIVILILVTCFGIPAYVFTLFEDSWDFLDGFYFCFISLTTVGLGDFVPGVNSHEAHADLYRIGSAIFMMYGIMMLMFFLTLTTEFILHRHEDITIPVSIHPEETPDKQSQIPSYGTVGSVTVQITEGERQPLLQT